MTSVSMEYKLISGLTDVSMHKFMKVNKWIEEFINAQVHEGNEKLTSNLTDELRYELTWELMDELRNNVMH